MRSQCVTPSDGCRGRPCRRFRLHVAPADGRAMRERIRVLVVAADPRLTRVLARALPARGAVVVSGPIADADEAADILAADLADLAVVDLDRADGLGLDVLTTVAAGG